MELFKYMEDIKTKTKEMRTSLIGAIILVVPIMGASLGEYCSNLQYIHDPVRVSSQRCVILDKFSKEPISRLEGQQLEYMLEQGMLKIGELPEELMRKCN